MSPTKTYSIPLTIAVIIISIAMAIWTQAALAHDDHTHGEVSITVLSAKLSGDALAIELIVHNETGKPVQLKWISYNGKKVAVIGDRVASKSTHSMQGAKALRLPKSLAESQFIALGLEYDDDGYSIIPVIMES
ncbi:MAG: hypothetical protein AAF468_01000 [Pseudomonadota bacterium]